jgi:hypothetical protein
MRTTVAERFPNGNGWVFTDCSAEGSGLDEEVTVRRVVRKIDLGTEPPGNRPIAAN